MGDAGELDPIATEILAPLVALQARYLATQKLMTRLLDGLAPLAELRKGPTVDSPPAETRADASRTGPGPLRADLKVDSDDLDVLLDFQERLATVEGVESIALAGTTDGGTRVIVELVGGSPQRAPVPPKDGELPTLLCGWCGRFIRAGNREVSHGLCEDCAARVLGANPKS